MVLQKYGTEFHNYIIACRVMMAKTGDDVKCRMKKRGRISEQSRGRLEAEKKNTESI